MRTINESLEFVTRLIQLLYLLLPIGIAYVALRAYFALHGVAPFAYACIDTLPNSLCDAIIQFVGY
jgi:hypothetical protein